ncbi:collagen binding domain-containing protein [Nocardioides sp. SYSU D00038]|uniref:MSCRAMM family protein n=1 Tax=Nocardioides sp. SYSU D00038 TaxID=2812554 RepID=UPI001967C211|nr:carboxypeptidase regulatory-like domain-containing protein [Nocardioides sp. SYSU D00038]
MTTRTPAVLLALALGTATLAAVAPAPASAGTAATTRAMPAQARGVVLDSTYYSRPPALLGGAERAEPEEGGGPRRAGARPEPPPTRGVVTGRVVGPAGKPIRNALVMGIRYSDLGAPIDLTTEKRVVARTGKKGTFRLKQLRRPYLVRICKDQQRSQECTDDLAVKHFTPTWVGPDGVTTSWLRHSRMFAPKRKGRSLGTVKVKSSAVLSGTFTDGANRTVLLTRGNGSVAARTTTDASGRYRFEVAPGGYRVEADRHEGLRTRHTVPGYRSPALRLKPGRITYHSFRTRHAGVVRGVVRSNGSPVAGEFIAITTPAGEFAAGVVTDGQGRYAVTSLRPGPYVVRTSAAYSSHVPAARSVRPAAAGEKVVDLDLAQGAAIEFSASDPTGHGVIDAELRNAAGRVQKTYLGNPADEPGGKVVLTGLPAGSYKLYLRRGVDVLAQPEQTEFPWAVEEFTINNVVKSLGAIALDQPTKNVTGRLPRGAQVKITAHPEDVWLRADYVAGPYATPMALNWTEQGSSAGTYTVRGMVPGRYGALVTTAFVQPPTGRSRLGGNWATQRVEVQVNGPAPVLGFTPAKGATVRAKLRYAASKRRVIAPIGLQVVDSGDDQWQLDTVSGRQRQGTATKVDRLHPGRALVRLFDLDRFYLDHPDELTNDELVASARLAEPGTPYWLSTKPRTVRLQRARTSNLGWIDVRLRGVPKNQR